jgi:mRNA-degrading endonuclease RelE of RelBE toxin-antitoxin system
LGWIDSRRKLRLAVSREKTGDKIAIYQFMIYYEIMGWSVNFSNKAAKQYNKLPVGIQDLVDFLVHDIQNLGPIRGDWKNYSKLGKDKYHCHLKSGKPTYVACWEQINKEIRVVEVYYVGTHEKAPY